MDILELICVSWSSDPKGQNNHGTNGANNMIAPLAPAAGPQTAQFHKSDFFCFCLFDGARIGENVREFLTFYFAKLGPVGLNVSSNS